MATILMKEFGKQWSNLSESERKPFDDLALKGKLRPPPLLKTYELRHFQYLPFPV